MTKKNKQTGRGGNFDLVYDYISGKHHFYPSFKILYNSPKIIEEKEEIKIKKCLFDFLIEIGSMELEKNDEIFNDLIRNVNSTKVKNLFEKKCKMVQSENNISLGNYISPDKKMDKHLFYKINLANKFILELEHCNLPRVNDYDEKEKKLNYFQDEKLNEIIDQFYLNPKNVSTFVVRQIEFGGDKLFERIFENLEQKLYLEIMGYS